MKFIVLFTIFLFSQGLWASQTECTNSGGKWTQSQGAGGRIYNRCLRGKKEGEKYNEWNEFRAEVDDNDVDKAFKDFARDELKDSVDHGEDRQKELANGNLNGTGAWTNNLGGALQSLTAGFTITNWLFVNGKNKIHLPSCSARWLMLGGSVLAIGLEVYDYIAFQDELDALEESYKNSTSTGEFGRQIEAFQTLKSEQELISEFSKKKMIGHIATTAIFSAAVIAFFVDSSCYVASTWPGPRSFPLDDPSLDFLTNDALRSLELKNGENTKQCFRREEYSQMVWSLAPLISTKKEGGLEQLSKKAFNFFVSKAHAGNDSKKDAFNQWLIGTGLGAGLGAFSAVGLSLDGSGLGQKLLPVIAGVSAAGSATIAINAGIQMNRASKNAAAVDQVITKFREGSYGICVDDKVNDLNHPECYCYNSDGTKNLTRSKSATCQVHWSDGSLGSRLESGNYSAAKAKGCVDYQNKFDPTCKCRKFKDSRTGHNACKKGSGVNINIGNQGVQSDLSSAGSMLDSVFQGEGVPQDLNSADLINRAARLRKASKEVLKKNTKGDLAQIASIGQAQKAYPKLLGKKLASAISKLKPNNRTSLSASLGQGGSAEKRKAREALLKSPSYSSQSAAGPTKRKKKTFFSLNSGRKKKVEHFKSKRDFDYKAVDIHQDSEKSLWDIIGHRYNQSLENLFQGP